jgi:hypothetical protein
MKGSLLITYDDRGLNNLGTPHFLVEIQPNSSGAFISRDLHYTNADRLYSTYLDNNDTVRFTIYRETGYTSDISLVRYSYTNDDEAGDNGVKQNTISGTTQVLSTYDVFTFPVSVLNTSYDFEYRIDIGIIPSFNYYSISRYSCTFLGECTLASTGTTINNSVPLQIGKFYNDLSGATGNVIEIDFQVVPNTGATTTNITSLGYDTCDFLCPQPNFEGRFSLYRGTQWSNTGTFSDYVTRKSNLWGQSISTVTGGTLFSDAYISEDGKFQSFSSIYPNANNEFVGGSIYKSSDSGTTWSTVSSVTSGFTRSGDWTGMDGSQNGRYVALTQSWGPYFYSLDSGNTFSFITQSNKNWIKPFIPDSQPLPMYGLATDGIYRLDSLSGPFTKLTGATTTTSFLDGAISQDRRYIVLTTTDETTTSGYTLARVLLSTNSGQTFSTVYTNDYNFPGGKVNMSASGQYVYITYNVPNVDVTPSNTLYSNDYGSTWSSIPYNNLLGPISVSDTSERQFKIRTDDTISGIINYTYYCDNFLSGCTEINQHTVSNSGFNISGFTYQDIVQNKQYLGTEPSYSPLSAPATPTYGPWYLRSNLTLNYSGITSGDYKVSRVGFDVNIDAPNNFDKTLYSVDSLNKITLTGSTGSVTSDYVYFNNPSITGTTLSQNDFFLLSLENVTGTTKIPRSATYNFYIDGVLNQSRSQSFTSPNYNYTLAYDSGTNIPVGTTGKTASLTVDMVFDTLPVRTNYTTRDSASATTTLACNSNTDNSAYLAGSDTNPVTGLTVYNDVWLSDVKVGNGNYYILRKNGELAGQVAVRINSSGVITEVSPCPTPTPTPIPPTPSPTPLPTATPIPPIVYDADALAFLNAAGIVDQNISYGINELVIGLKNNNLWNKMFAFYPFVGATENSCKFNLRNPQNTNAAYRLSFSSCQFLANGLRRDTTSAFARTFLNPVVVNATTGITASVAFGVWSSGTVSDGIDIGSGPLNATGRMIINPNDGTFFTGFNYGRTDNTQVTATSAAGAGLFTSSRTSLTSHKIYKNGVLFGTKTVAQNSSFLPNLDFYILRERPTSQPVLSSPRTIGIAFISTGLTDGDNVNLYNVCQAFQIQLGR